MRLVILDDYELASEWAAKYIQNRIVQFQPSKDRYFTLGLPTGMCLVHSKKWNVNYMYIKKYICRQ